MDPQPVRSATEELYGRVVRAAEGTPTFPTDDATISAANLLAYRELRRYDISELQMTWLVPGEYPLPLRGCPHPGNLGHTGA